MIEDSILLWRFKQGSVAALEKICRKYNSYLLTVAVGLTGDYQEAEDCLQDFFISFMESAEKIKLKGNLKSYMAVCVSNVARNRIKRRHLEPALLDQLPDESVDTETPEWLAVRSEETLQLTRALFLLPYEQRETIILRLHGNMTLNQIAKLRNVSINTIAGRYRYGIEKLRTILERQACNEK